MEQIKNLFPQFIVDLKSLYENRQVKNAITLSNEFEQVLGQKFLFAPHKSPHYPTKNLDAKTVFVHLNPGSGLDVKSNIEEQFWNGIISCTILNPKDFNSFEHFVKEFVSLSNRYGQIRFGEKKEFDVFDYKQSRFLKSFKESGIDIIDGNNPEAKRQNCLNVIDQKLQLELLPYGSNTINTPKLTRIMKKKPELLTPYIEKLLDVITLYPRKYVIFGSNVYLEIFTLYHKFCMPIINYKSETFYFKDIIKNSLRFTYIELEWNKRIFNAGIAHSFPSRALPTAYEKMELYGNKCYEIYIKETNRE